MLIILFSCQDLSTSPLSQGSRLMPLMHSSGCVWWLCVCVCVCVCVCEGERVCLSLQSTQTASAHWLQERLLKDHPSSDPPLGKQEPETERDSNVHLYSCHIFVINFIEFNFCVLLLNLLLYYFIWLYCYFILFKWSAVKQQTFL